MKMTPMMDGGMVSIDMKMAAPDLANTTPGMLLWSKRFGGTGDDTPTAVLADKSGNIVLTGTFTGTTDLGGGPLASQGDSAMFLAKYLSDGTHVWSRRYNAARVNDIATDTTDAVIAVGFLSTGGDFGSGTLPVGGFIAKFSSTGGLMWAKTYSNTIFNGVTTDSSNNILLAGGLFADTDLGGGLLTNKGMVDILLTKLSPEGIHIWSKSYGNAKNEMGGQISIDLMGNIFVAGGAEEGSDAGGGALHATLPSTTLMTKYSSTGTHIWSKIVGAQTTTPYIPCLALDQTGNSAVGSIPSSDSALIYLSTHSPSGGDRWTKSRTPPQTVYGLDASFDSASRLITAILCTNQLQDIGGKIIDCSGSFFGAIIKFTPDGDYLWHKRTPNSEGLFTRIATDADQIIVADTFKNTVDLGSGPLTSIGKRDIVLYKLAP
jgi:hypothetical protein